MICILYYFAAAAAAARSIEYSHYSIIFPNTKIFSSLANTIFLLYVRYRVYRRDGPPSPAATEGVEYYGYGQWSSAEALGKASFSLMAAAQMAKDHFVRTITLLYFDGEANLYLFVWIFLLQEVVFQVELSKLKLLCLFD